MRKLMLVLVFALVVPMVLTASDSKSRIGTKASAAQLCYQLWADTNFGWNNKQERAAWVVRGSDGTVQWIEWNHKEGYTLTTWNKPVPEGTFAEVHTHKSMPNPEPTIDDVTTAQELKIPVYTVSGSGIWRVAANGEITKEADNNWYKTFPHVEVKTHIKTQRQ